MLMQIHFQLNFEDKVSETNNCEKFFVRVQLCGFFSLIVSLFIFGRIFIERVDKSIAFFAKMCLCGRVFLKP